MEPRLQRRIQRHGWDLASTDYETLWRRQLAISHARLLAAMAPQPGERIVDVACGTGMLTLACARAVGPRGSLLGVDLSERMVEVARHRAREAGIGNAAFERMDAERLDLPASTFDAAVCGFGVMYMPDPARALREMARVLRPGGRIALATWGARGRCAWSPVFAIVDAEVASDVCPLFFRLGDRDALVALCAEAGLETVDEQRFGVALDYVDAQEACDACFVGGPMALAWSRFDAAARERVRARYLEAIERWRCGEGYRLPSEVVLVMARASASPESVRRSAPRR